MFRDRCLCRAPGLAFVGAGTAHAAFAGVALAYLVGLPPLPLAIVFGLATVWTTGLMEERGRMKLDVSIGIRTPRPWHWRFSLSVS